MVETTASNDRAQIKADLHAEAQKHIDAADGYEKCDTSEATLKVDGKDCKVALETKRVWVEG